MLLFRSKSLVFLFVGLLFLLASFVTFDLLYKEKAYLNPFFSRLGLTKINFVREVFSPKLHSLPVWGESDFYWYSKDQRGLDGSKGFNCAVAGKLLDLPRFGFWQVKAKSGQIFSADTRAPEINYIVRHPYFDEEVGQWMEFPRVAGMNDFEQGDIVLIEWNCPIDSPRFMVEQNNLVKEEFLKVNPDVISRREKTEDVQ